MGNFKVKTDKQTYNQVKALLLESGFRISAPTGNDWVIGELGGIISSYSAWNGKPPEWFFAIKEITIPELRDMVVLKRNDVNDATHENNVFKYVELTDGWYYFDLSCTDKWQKSSGAKPEYYEKLKPIEKTMKEYLDKDYVLREVKQTSGDNRVPSDWIEIPEGAKYYATDSNLGIKKNYFFRCPDDAIWVESQWMRASFSVDGQDVLWKCEPEAESLVDWSNVINNAQQIFDHENAGKPSLNDQYAEIEQVRQSAYDKQEGGSHYKKLAIQPMQYALANKLDYAQANVVKYVTRHADKNGKEDLLKAIHNIELMIEHYYSDS